MIDTYDTTQDYSKDFEIRKTKDGRIFGIRNLRIDPKNGNVIGDLSGDPTAGMEYLEAYADSIMKSLLKQQNPSLGKQ